MAVWAVDGADTPASLGRLVADAAMKGEAGVLAATDYRVTELPVPGAFVRVLPGGASISNTYVEDGRQKYITLDESLVDVPVTPTGSSPAGGVDKWVIKTVRDPQYPNVQAPADGAYDFFDVVTVGIELDTYPHPYVPLYEFHQPANEATFYKEYIARDLREVANPKEKTVPVVRASLSTDDGLVLNATGAAGEWFPNDGGNWVIPIPEWATRVIVLANWEGVNTQGGTNPYGAKWVEFGPYAAPSTRERKIQESGFNSPVNGDIARGDWGFSGSSYIPAAYRGTDQLFVMKARYNGADKGIYMDGYSSTSMLLIFQQVPDTFESPSL